MNKTGIIAAAALAGMAACAGVKAAETKWRDRVIPLPKQMAVTETIHSQPEKIRLEINMATNAPALDAIRNLLEPSAPAGPGAAELVIRLVDINACPNALPAGSAAKVRQLPLLPNADQAYIITSAKGHPSCIILAAAAPPGLLYAARTLSQLIKIPPQDVQAGTLLEIPLPEILDWPDMAQRGNWGWDNRHLNLEFVRRFTRWKLNMFKAGIRSEADISGKITKFMLFWSDDYSRDVFNPPNAAEYGLTVIPYLGHLSSRSEKDWQGIAVPVLPPGAAKPRHPGFCMSNPDIIRLLAAHMERMAEMIQGYGKDIEIWLTENTKIECHCEGCQGKNMYVLEAQGILKAFAKAKEKYPWLRLRITLSQGSFRAGVNAGIIALLPRDVGVAHYGDAQTYIPDRRPIIFPELAEFARAGGMVDVYPTITPSWFAIFPGVMPQFLHYRAREFADNRLDAVTSFLTVDLRYFDFNLAALGEWTWNAYGRSPYEFARAYATVTGLAEPELFARWALRHGEAAWTLAETGLLQSLSRNPSGGISYPVIQRNMPSTAALNGALINAREALKLARQGQDAFMEAESSATFAALQSIPLMRDIESLLQDRLIRNDAARRGKLSEKLDALLWHAQLVRAGIYEWDRQARAQPEPRLNPYPSGGNSRLRPTAYGLLRTADKYRRAAGLPDDSSLSSPGTAKVIAHWAATNTRQNAISMEINISEFAAGKGGYYNLGLTLTNGGPARIDRLELSKIDRATGRKTSLAVTPVSGQENLPETADAFFDYQKQVQLTMGRTELDGFCDYLCKLPGHAPAENIHLTITVSGKMSAGCATIRPVWQWHGFPWDILAAAAPMADAGIN